MIGALLVGLYVLIGWPIGIMLTLLFGPPSMSRRRLDGFDSVMTLCFGFVLGWFWPAWVLLYVLVWIWNRVFGGILSTLLSRLRDSLLDRWEQS